MYIDTAEHVVSIWDIKYGTLQAERILHLADKSACGKDKCIYKVRNVYIGVCIHTYIDKNTNRKEVFEINNLLYNIDFCTI